MAPQPRQHITFPADVRQANSALNPCVELLILDYLAYDALHAAFRSHEGATRGTHGATDQLNHTVAESARTKLRMVDQFVALYQHRHQSLKSLPQPQHFRLALLRFITLFRHSSSSSSSTESSPALDSLRCANRRRASAWWARRRGHYSTPSSSEAVGDPADILADILNKIDGATESGSTDTGNEGAEPTLLDLLPMFFELTAERTRFKGCEWVASEMWLRLACEFMTQAFLEQRVNFEVKGCSALLEAFAWGPMPKGATSDEDEPADTAVHSIFLTRDDDDSAHSSSSSASSSTNVGTSVTNDQYAFLRDRTITDLDPANGGRDRERLSSADVSIVYKALLNPNHPIDPHPRNKFEGELMGFMRALEQSVDVPILKQLEQVQMGERTVIGWGGDALGQGQTEQLREMWMNGLGWRVDQVRGAA